MAEWTDEDIALARQLLDLRQQSSTCADFEDQINAMAARYYEAMEAKYSAKKRKRLESGYKGLLASTGGDADVLAQVLYRELIDAKNVNFNNASPAVLSSTGRPPDKWGRDAAGKLMLFFCIEEAMQGMRAEGIPRPKIKNAIARTLKITQQQRKLESNIAKIDDYASRYSEAKKILKGRV